MRTMNLIALSAVTLLGGCWPYLNQPYEDYLETGDVDTTDPDTDGREPDTDDPDTDDPDTEEPDGDGPTVVGWTDSSILMGDYWTPSDSAVVALMGLAAPGANYSFISSWPSRGSCADTASPGPDLVEITSPRGLPNSVSLDVGSRSLSITPDVNVSHLLVGERTFSGTPDFNAAVIADFTASAGRFTGTLSRTPSDFTVTSPSMDTASPPTLSSDILTVSWSAVGGDDVIVEFLFVDLDEEIVTDGTFCTASGSSVTIDIADFDAANAEYVDINVRRVRTFSGSLGGSAGGTARMASVLSKRGVAFLP